MGDRRSSGDNQSGPMALLPVLAASASPAMQTHDTRPAGFQPAASAPKAKPLPPPSFEVVEPGRGSTNPFPPRPHEMWTAEPAAVGEIALPEVQAVGEPQNSGLNWTEFRMSAPGAPPTPPPNLGAGGRMPGVQRAPVTPEPYWYRGHSDQAQPMSPLVQRSASSAPETAQEPPSVGRDWIKHHFRMNAPGTPPSPPPYNSGMVMRIPREPVTPEPYWYQGPPVQAKLTVGAPNDAYEQEADQVAAQVMAMPEPTARVQRQTEAAEIEDSEATPALQAKPLAATITPLVQRQELPESEESLQLKCTACEPEDPIQRTATGDSQVQPNLESRLSASQSGGNPLSDEVRGFMEPRFGADFSQVRVHTGSDAVQMNQELGAQAFTHGSHIYYGAGKAPAKDELTGHELTHVVQQTGNVTRHLQRWDMDNAPIGDPMRDPRLRHLRPRTARQRYQEFIDNAERYGMPVRFLRYVERNYGIASGGSDAVTPAINRMSLEEETLQSVEHLSPMLPFGEGTGVQTVYHESTHAYFDLASGDRAVSDVIRQGEAHYEDAPLRGSRTGDDPERIFQEAAASYVGHRVSCWWSAFESLSIAAAGEIPHARLAQWIDRTRNDYNNRMAERTFGYQETDGFLGFGTSQTETTRQITQQLKDFLDNQLLEGKIPDNFDEVEGFWQLIEQATITRTSEDTSQTDSQIQPKYDLTPAAQQLTGDRPSTRISHKGLKNGVKNLRECNYHKASSGLNQ